MAQGCPRKVVGDPATVPSVSSAGSRASNAGDREESLRRRGYSFSPVFGGEGARRADEGLCGMGARIGQAPGFEPFMFLSPASGERLGEGVLGHGKRRNINRLWCCGAPLTHIGARIRPCSRSEQSCSSPPLRGRGWVRGRSRRNNRLISKRFSRSHTPSPNLSPEAGERNMKGSRRGARAILAPMRMGGLVRRVSSRVMALDVDAIAQDAILPPLLVMRAASERMPALRAGGSTLPVAPGVAGSPEHPSSALRAPSPPARGEKERTRGVAMDAGA